MKVECPTCGKEGFKNDRGMRIHHTRSHGEKLPHYTVCDECGSEVEYTDSSWEPFYCEDCRYDVIGEKAGKAQEVDRVEDECEWCGETYSGLPCRVEPKRFCSPECKDEWSSGENHPRWTREEVQCENCGDSQSLPKCRLEEFDKHFCDSECYGEWCIENRKGELNPNWEGGWDPYYGENWYRKRREVRERDDYTCQICGEVEGVIDVHHITPIRKFDKPENANTMNNLITLCRSCHTAVENGTKECPEP